MTCRRRFWGGHEVISGRLRREREWYGIEREERSGLGKGARMRACGMIHEVGKDTSRKYCAYKMIDIPRFLSAARKYISSVSVVQMTDRLSRL